MIDDTSANAGFPVKKILLAAAATPLSLGVTIVKKSVPGIVALVLAYLLLIAVATAASGAGGIGLFGLGFIAVFGLFIYSYTILAVTMHRIFLLGAESIPGNGFTSWTYRETRFFGWGIALGLTAGIIGAVSVGVMLSLVVLDLEAIAEQGASPALSFWTFVGLLPMAYLLGRMSFVLPGTATGSRPTFGWSWDLTRRYQWQTMLVIGITPLAINLVVELLAAVLPALLAGLISIVLGVYLAIFGIAVLSFSYRTLCELQPDIPPPPLEDTQADQDSNTD